MSNPPSRLRWPMLLLSGLGATALLLVLLVLLLNRVFPAERVASLLSAQVKAATGREFAVRGKLSIRLLPRIGISADDVVLGNAIWGSRKEMLVVEHARFDVALWPLLQGLVHIASVSLSGADLLLESDRNGVGNWVMTGAGGDDSAVRGRGDRSPLRLALTHLALTEVRLAYRDARKGSTTSLLLNELQLDSVGDGHRLEAGFDGAGRHWQLSGPIGRLSDLAADEADWPFDLRLSSDGAVLAAKGLLRRGPLPRTVEADISASISRPDAIAAWLPAAAGMPLPLELKGRLHQTPALLRIEGLQLTLAQQSLSGQLRATPGNPWKVHAQLAAQSIDLARWLPQRPAPPGAGAASAEPASTGRGLFATTPLGLDALPAGPGTLALRVDRLLVPGLPPLTGVEATLQAQPGRFRADPFSFGLAGGSLRGSIGVATAPGTPPRVALQLQGRNLSVDELLRASGHTGFAHGGRLQLRADLDLGGDTAAALAARANGQLLLDVADTTLAGGGPSPLGSDLLTRVLQALSLQPRAASPLRVRCAVVRLPLTDGVARVERSIAIETEQLALSASGEIRFDDQTLTLAFRPSSVAGQALKPMNLAQLVVLKGPWADPKLTLDAQGVAGMAASLGLAGATGGLSLLAQQLLKSAPDKDVCRVARNGAAPAPGTTGSAPADAAPRSPKAPPPARLPALPEALRGIFR